MRTIFLLTSLLSICGISLAQNCQREFLENIDFPGTDIKFVYAADATHCQQLCTQHSSCLFFTFLRSEWTRDRRTFYCYLKSTSSGRPNRQTALQGVTSGYSLKPCGPHPVPCVPEAFNNIDFPGADYRFLFTADYEECQRACTQDPFCQFFTFANDAFSVEKIRHKCHLKFSWSIPITYIVKAKTGLVSGFSHNVDMYSNTEINDNSTTGCQRKLFPGLNIPSGDVLEVPAVSTEHCHALCTAHPKCTFFSFDGNGYKCHLKENPNEMTFQRRTSFTSGLPSRFCQPDNSWTKVPFEGIDFGGSDIGFKLMDDAESCQQTCTSDALCQFYTYVTSDYSDRSYWRRCFHKRTLTMPVLPKVTNLNNVVSGFTMRNCGPSASQSNSNCQREFLQDIDFPGTDIKFVYAADATHCQHLCTHHASCLFFTFLRPDFTKDSRNFYCYLKSTSSGQPNRQTALQGVTSGYSLKPCGPHPAPCLSEVYHNIDFPGADYRFLFTADYDECQRACTQDPFCQFFTFANDAFSVEKIRHKCHLKYSWTIPITYIVEAKPRVVSGFSHNVDMYSNTEINDNSTTGCQRKLFPGLNIPSGDVLEVPAVSTEHCHALCTAHPKCTFFSFDGNGYKCHLKENPNEMTFQRRTSFTSGLPSRFCQPDNSWTKVPFEGIDFRGSDIGYELMDDAESCQQTCTTDALCQFYTYVNSDFRDPTFWRRCYHKRTLTMPVLPKVTKLNNVVSGFSLRNCDSSTEPVKTAAPIGLNLGLNP